ncbi:MAG: TauD/TfdA family dioxygenase [Polyangiaceae bacterium]
MQVSRLSPNEPLPGLITPEGNKDLLAVVRAEREQVRKLMQQHGAILFRGYDVTTPGQFGEICAALTNELLDYTERSTPRNQVEGKVYTSTEYPPEAHIPLHCEMAYTTKWPRILWMYSHVAAQEGGETPIADARKVFETISPATRQRFIDKGGVMYVRNFRKGIDLPWQEVYDVSTEAELEDYCKKNNIAFEWREGGVLRTKAIAQAVARHPETGEMAWFNQAHLFHVTSVEPGIRKILIAKFKEDGLPRNSYYGDGTPIEDAVLDEIRGVYAKTEVAFPWQRGDVIMIDNMLVSHGRRPFKGPRKTLVAMAEAYSPS